MNTIPAHFAKNGYHYQLLERTPHAALYSQSTVPNLPPAGKACAYEVVRVRVRPERKASATMGGFTFPGGEYLPNTEEWGRHGWTFPTLDGAKVRLGEIGPILPSIRQRKGASTP